MSSYKFEPLAGMTVAGSETHGSVVLPNGSAWTLAVTHGAKCILMQALTQNIRYTLNGQAPNATFGFQMKAGDAPVLMSVDRGVTLRFFAETNGAILQYELGANAL